MKAKIAISLGPANAPSAFPSEEVRQITSSVESGGGEIVDVQSADALAYLSVDGEPLRHLLDTHSNIKWVQLPWAGVETFAAQKLFDRDVRFTCAKDTYGPQVGEHAVMLAMAVLRNVVKMTRRKSWHRLDPVGLLEKRVTVVGAGGIARVVIRHLLASDCDITVVRRHPEPVDGADRVVAVADLDSVLPETDVLILAPALTAETTGMIGAHQISLLPSSAVIVNVGRGKLIDTEALTAALLEGRIAGAGLDVTEPEPLPEDHRLWQLDNVLITSHAANSNSWAANRLAERVSANVRNFASGRELEGLVDPGLEY